MPVCGLSETLMDFYRTSPMREGVLCWYPFERGARVLDLSGGVLTALLRHRGTRVSTYLGEGGEGFDYIVALDPVDLRVDTLNRLHALLGPHGRLLLAYENPFALRYWSGKRAPNTGVPYDTLTGRDGKPGKAEVCTRLAQAGFGGQKWYYPLTDHWFTRELYSESYLPNEYLNQRFIAYMSSDGILQFDERVLYREVIRNGAFEFMCGAYLVEARADAGDVPCAVDYAAITAYREPSKRFATTVRNDGTARKTPLHPHGHASVRRIQRNHEELTRLGVDVVPSVLEGESLVMPRMDMPTLWDYWAEKLSRGVLDEEELMCQFDRIRDAVYKAAQSGRCFWELVPANCFFDAAQDRLIFFDQEYTWDGAPPEVALARALWSLGYSPMLSADARTTGWMERLIARYGLAGQWGDLSVLVNGKSNLEVFGEGTRALERETERAAEQAAEATRYRRFLPVAKKLEDLGFTHPALYGHGLRGKTLLRALRDCGVAVVAVVDRRFASSETVFDLSMPTWYGSVEEIPRHAVDVVLVSLHAGEETAAFLRGRVDIPVYTVDELLDTRNE